ncbi:HigA family addiction module antitoxin [Iningainema tapete]|uniref:HigA family addiction module antidote protein n=1 Tax=Iningainema tapete BLCC-T55 TaxID=2748662 RepID=A0A8J6XDV3_9CYAN|nr:HigA family addiction module antitoxin [Iningainema tapete]MBD2774380.1 HigA family addiction module antidote protein [Iningainema tapete BLCC-T55]
MSNTIQNQYKPDYVSPPGETLQEVLEERGMSQAELAERMGRPKKTINEIINAKAAITPETALQLERVLSIPASFWNNRERRYQEAKVRAEEQERLQKQLAWLKQIPVQAMVKFGWIQRCQDKVEQLRFVLNFFAVASVEQWEEVWSSTHVYFRKSQVFQSDFGHVIAWLRRGEIEAAEIKCAIYDANKFREALQQIRTLTVKPPEIFQPEVVRLCAEAGVAVVFVPQLPKTRTCGATRWLNPNKALIQLSLRYKTDDHLWFAFFHEAGHILLHGKRDVFLEDKGVPGVEKDDKEKGADKFAADILIPPTELKRFLVSGQQQSKAGILQFATEIGIAPGILVGRLQHDGVLPSSHWNDLKQRLEWAFEAELD